MRIRFDTSILLTLTCATTLLAVVLANNGVATWLEAASFVTGAICVWLTVKESVWNFPISLINVATFCIVFFRARLFADAGLQIVYFALTLVGWYLWLYGGERKTALHIVRTKKSEGIAVIIAIALTTLALWAILHALNGTATFWDALTTAISLGAQWLLNRKRLENWIAWIIVDVIYIPLYLYKDLRLTALLYCVFLIMAITGYLQWCATLRRQTAPAPSKELAEALA